MDDQIENMLNYAKSLSRQSESRNSNYRRSPSREREHRRSRHDGRRRDDGDRDRRERRRSKERSSRNSKVNRDYPFDRILRNSPERESFWDVPPVGYEHMTTQEFRDLRATGALSLLQNNETGSGNILQRLCFGNLTENCTEERLMAFVNENMQKSKLIIHPGDPCVAVQLNSMKTYALVHMRSQEETNNALLFDGAIFDEVPIIVRRPKEYIPPVGMVHQGTGAMTGMLADSLNKLFVACLPTYLNDEQVRELLQAFGELKAFNLVKDAVTGISKGYAFCEFLDPAVTDLAIAGLHQMQVGDKRLVVQRAVLGAKCASHYNAFMMAQLQVPGIDSASIAATEETEATRVICLMNMVTIDDLIEDEEYEDIFEDIRAECSKYGHVLSMSIPRPCKTAQHVPGIEKVFVEYDNVDNARSAYNALAGRKFSGRIVITAYFDHEKYQMKDF